MSALSKKSKILIGLSVLIIVIAGISFAKRDRAGTFSGTMFDLFERGGNVKCAWAQSESDLNAQGVVFISGKKFKSETISSSGSVTLAAHALSDGEYFYAWTSLAPLGIRTDLSDLKKEAKNNTPQTNDLNKDYTFECQPWDVDDAAFAIPMDIVFSPIPPQIQE